MKNRCRKIIRELVLKWRNPSRYIIERKIFPKIKNKRVLLVGVADYIEDYPQRLKENDLWSRKDLNPWLASLYVINEYRNKGIATQLIHSVCKKAQQLGIDTMYLFLAHTEMNN